MIARLTLLAAAGAFCFTSCASVQTLQRWDPSRAQTDAERDIAAKNIRFAYVGGRAPLAPGLPDGASRVTCRYPRLPVGDQGCVQDQGSDVRWDYARRYNIWMWRYVTRDAT